MKMAVRLPVHPSPGLSTECYHNCRLSILRGRADALPWIHSHYINLTAHDPGGGSFPSVRFEEHIDVYAEVLDEAPLDRGKGWHDAVREAIGRGSYVIAFLNWRYLPASRYFGRQDKVHEALIYGYDDGDGSFDALAFDVDGQIYGALRIDYRLFARELDRTLEREIQSQQWFAYYGFPIVEVACREPFRDAVDERAIYFALDRGKVKPVPNAEESFASGCHVYELTAQLFSSMRFGRRIAPAEFELWNISIYKMVQHNRKMLERIDYLALGGRSPELEKIRGYFEKAAVCLSQARAASLQAQRGHDPDSLKLLETQFRKIFELEMRAIPLFKHYLVNNRLRLYRNESREESRTNALQ